MTGSARLCKDTPSDAASVAREEETMSAAPDLGARILDLSVSALFGLWRQSIAWHGQRALALTPDDER